jgi:X-X-X-Leu-X-X-Gly heptad repeat protein
MQILLQIVAVALLVKLLRQTRNQQAEIKTIMNEQETRLNEALAAAGSNLQTLTSSTTQLADGVTRIQAEIQKLKDNNPELSDEIATAEKFAGDTKALADKVSAIFPDAATSGTTPTTTPETSGTIETNSSGGIS